MFGRKAWQPATKFAKISTIANKMFFFPSMNRKQMFFLASMNRQTYVKNFGDVSIGGLHIGPRKLGPEGFDL